MVINGILWIDHTGAPWQDLPERYGPWQTCADWLYGWQRNGLWTRLLQSLQAQADAQESVEWEGAALDSTSIKAHPHAAGARHVPAQKGGPQANRQCRHRAHPHRPRPTRGRRSDAVEVV
jgi:transposase